jgi:hypothetical protein
MSVSFKYLCVGKEKIIEIPKNKIRDRKFTKKELSGQDILRLEIIYDIQNKKPNNIIRILFDRITFDRNGECDFRRKREESKRIYDYMFDDNVQSPLPIPKALFFPTKSEIITIKNYLNRKYPALLKNEPYAIEYAILDGKEQYKQNIQKFIKSHQSYK